MPGSEDQSESISLVVLQAEDRQFGLVVDSISDTQEIVVKPLGKRLKGLSCYAGACIMGDGKVALILDVMGLAQRAKVINEARAHGLLEKATESTNGGDNQHAFLLFAGPDDARMAVPLATVARLEEIPLAQAESAGTQRVTQYRGKILPLLDLRDALEERRHRRRNKPNSPDVVAPSLLQVVVGVEKVTEIGR